MKWRIPLPLALFHFHFAIKDVISPLHGALREKESVW